MKKILGLGALALVGLALAGCSGNGEKVETKDLIGLNGLNMVNKLGTQKVLYKKDSKVPYVELGEGAALMNSLRSTILEDEKCGYKASVENNNYVLTNEKGAKCVISPEKQTITFDEFDMFTYNVAANQDPLAITTLSPKAKALKTISSKYTKGHEVVVDLNKYSMLDIYQKDGDCYLPLSVFNNVLYNTNTSYSLAYNGKEFFMFTSGALTTKGILGLPELSEFGKRYHEGTPTLTKEFMEYNYQSLCLDFDYVYGLKEKFKTFDEFVNKIGYKDKMLSTDPMAVDNALAVVLSYLNDGHTAFADFNYAYSYDDAEIDEDKLNPEKQAHEKADEAFAKARTKAGVKEGIEYFSDSETVFISFAEFTELNEGLLYGEKDDDTESLFRSSIYADETDPVEALKRNDTGYLFSQLYKDLTSDLHKWTTKNIVVDLAANNGGSANSLIYSLSVLLGEIKVDITNPLSGAHCQQAYKADMNLDGVIDGNDKSLYELGYKIYFLDSKYSFSSANAMPVLAKLNNANVITLGDKTAGGPCAVRYNVSPLGSGYNSSSLCVISKLVDGKYVNIDDGVEADYKLTEEQMINRKYIAENISKWVKK